jgi:hypothetical protein
LWQVYQSRGGLKRAEIFIFKIESYKLGLYRFTEELHFIS